MTSLVSGSHCVLCSGPVTVMIEPPRRTLARGLDPSDQSYSVTVILPDVALCDEHAHDVREGERFIGWCDDPQCRGFGEVGQSSPCGHQYEKLGASSRARAPRSDNPSTRQ